MDYIINNIEHILAAFGGLVTVATVITKLTPSKKDDAMLAKIIEIFSLITKNGVK